MEKICLIDKVCIPCQGGVLPLDQAMVEKFLAELAAGWQINAAGHLYKEYLFDDFMQPVGFANKIAKIAEYEAHHPDLNFSLGKVCR